MTVAGWMGKNLFSLMTDFSLHLFSDGESANVDNYKIRLGKMVLLVSFCWFKRDYRFIY